VNERLDPYSGRYFPREARTEALASLIRNERMVEGIVRSRTWGLMGERCDMEAQSFEKALDDWRRRVAEQKAMKPKVIERAVEKLKEL
jgi:hypothetical protein